MRGFAVILMLVGGMIGAGFGFVVGQVGIMGAGYPTGGPRGADAVNVFVGTALIAGVGAALGALPGFLILRVARESGGKEPRERRKGRFVCTKCGRDVDSPFCPHCQAPATAQGIDGGAR
jgi:hypothetical protein